MTDKERIEVIRTRQKQRYVYCRLPRRQMSGDIDFLLHQVEELEQHVAERDALLAPRELKDLDNDTERK
jgi:hypothetical protein